MTVGATRAGPDQQRLRTPSAALAVRRVQTSTRACGEHRVGPCALGQQRARVHGARPCHLTAIRSTAGVLQRTWRAMGLPPTGEPLSSTSKGKTPALCDRQRSCDETTRRPDARASAISNQQSAISHQQSAISEAPGWRPTEEAGADRSSATSGQRAAGAVRSVASDRWRPGSHRGVRSGSAPECRCGRARKSAWRSRHR